jgi:hypothetical protein
MSKESPTSIVLSMDTSCLTCILCTLTLTYSLAEAYGSILVNAKQHAYRRSVEAAPDRTDYRNYRLPFCATLYRFVKRSRDQKSWLGFVSSEKSAPFFRIKPHCGLSVRGTLTCEYLSASENIAVSVKTIPCGNTVVRAALLIYNLVDVLSNCEPVD